MLENLLEALRFSPNNIPLKIQVPKLYIDQGDFTEAEQHLIEVLKPVQDSPAWVVVIQIEYLGWLWCRVRAKVLAARSHGVK